MFGVGVEVERNRRVTTMPRFGVLRSAIAKHRQRFSSAGPDEPAEAFVQIEGSTEVKTSLVVVVAFVIIMIVKVCSEIVFLYASFGVIGRGYGEQRPVNNFAVGVNDCCVFADPG